MAQTDGTIEGPCFLDCVWGRGRFGNSEGRREVYREGVANSTEIRRRNRLPKILYWLRGSKLRGSKAWAGALRFWAGRGVIEVEWRRERVFLWDCELY